MASTPAQQAHDARTRGRAASQTARTESRTQRWVLALTYGYGSMVLPMITGVGGYTDFPHSMQRVLEVGAALSMAGGIAAVSISSRRANGPTAFIAGSDSR